MIRVETYVTGLGGLDCPPMPLGELLDRVESKLGAGVAAMLPTVSQKLRIKTRKNGKTAKVIVHEEKLHAIGDECLKKELCEAIMSAMSAIEHERN